MAFQDIDDTRRNSAFVREQAGWDIKFAHWVSIIGSPLLSSIVAVSLVVSRASVPQAWIWGVAYLLPAVIMPLAFIGYLVKAGKASDFDVSIRRQRFAPMTVSLSGAIAGWLLVAFGTAPHLLVVLATTNIVLISLLFSITLLWKISVHTTIAASLAIWAWFLFGLMGLAFLLSLPLISWSRVRLGRHTVSQTIAGAILGSTAVYMSLLILGV